MADGHGNGTEERNGSPRAEHEVLLLEFTSRSPQAHPIFQLWRLFSEGKTP